MKIESLNKLKKDISKTNTDLYDLFSVNFFFNPNIELLEYTVTKDDEMRIDLVFLNIYKLDSIKGRYDITRTRGSCLCHHR